MKRGDVPGIRRREISRRRHRPERRWFRVHHPRVVVSERTEQIVVREGGGWRGRAFAGGGSFAGFARRRRAESRLGGRRGRVARGARRHAARRGGFPFVVRGDDGHERRVGRLEPARDVDDAVIVEREGGEARERARGGDFGGGAVEVIFGVVLDVGSWKLRLGDSARRGVGTRLELGV